MLARLLVPVAAFAFVAIAYGQQPAASAQPAAPASALGQVKILENPETLSGPIVVQDYAAKEFFFIAEEASQSSIGETMQRLIPQLVEATKQANVVPGGPITIVMRNVTPDPEAKFSVEVGFPLDAKIEPPADGPAEVRTLEAGRFGTMLLTGKLEPANMAQAYATLFTMLMGDGRVPTGEIRQLVLFAESDTSTNNVLLLMVGLQKQ